MLINSSLIEQLMTRTLQIKLYGMTESKKKEFKGSDPTPGGIDNLSQGYESSAGVSTAAKSMASGASAGQMDLEARIKYLEEQNRKLLKQLDEARTGLEKYEGKKEYEPIIITPGEIATPKKSTKTCVIF